MAEPALLDPSSHFDLRHYPPHLFDPDLHLAEAGLPLGAFAAGEDCDDLDFDLPADFSVEDFLLRSPDRSDDSAAGSGPTASPSSPSPSPTASGSGSAVADARCEVKHEDSDEGRSGAGNGASAPNWTLKRKQPSPAATSDAAKSRRRSGDGDGSVSPSPSASPSASASASATRAAAAADSDDGVPGAGGDGAGDDTRRAARLIRNRESAQLSRQRKKRYVEELEEKVKSMAAVITDLNSRISFVAAENATLRQQLGNPPPGVYPPGTAMPGMHFPWVPGYALRPHGSHVPLVPIPRLKPPPPPQQQPSATTKVTKKSDTKKTADTKSRTRAKTKKVASVSLIGLMFVMLIFGAFVPGFNHSFGMRGRSDSAMLRNFDQQPHDRVVTVASHGNKVPKDGLKNGDMSGADSGARMGTDDIAEHKHGPAVNASETLPALLYVPRNGKHVKINGNLIIHSVLASEKAVAHRTSKQKSDLSGIDHKEKSISVAHHLSLPGNNMNQQEKSPVDGPLPQWFREGMAGPILNSGMCSEVFQFDISTASTNSGGIIPSPAVNSSSVNATQNISTPAPAYYGKLKNRRIMYNEAIPLPGKTVNNTEPFNRTSESSKLPDKKPASSVVVSMLADPREAGDGDSDPRMSPKSLSRIFVVVLLDGVRYVTYSCTLPFKSSSPHLVN